MRTARTLLCATVLFVGLLPHMAGACMAAYMDFNVDTAQAEIEAWSYVEDYYSSSPCFDSASSWQYWEHYYEAHINLRSPTGNWASDSASTGYVPYGGGSATAYHYLSFQGDAGMYNIDWTAWIICTVGGYILNTGDGDVVEAPLYASYDEWPTDECGLSGSDWSPTHRGKDVNASVFGSDVRAMEDGVVKAIEPNGTPGGDENFVVVQGSDGMYTIYAHVTPSVVVNQTVSAGQKIGTVDDTGVTNGPHVHLCRSPDMSCNPRGVDYQLPNCP